MPTDKERPKPDMVAPRPVAAVDLNTAVTSIVTAVMAARVALDRETVQLAKLYQADEILRQFNAPAFAISEVTLHLPYAAIDVRPGEKTDAHVQDPRSLPHMLVQIGADALAQLPPHAVGTIDLKLSQQLLSLLMGEIGQG